MLSLHWANVLNPDLEKFWSAMAGLALPEDFANSALCRDEAKKMARI